MMARRAAQTLIGSYDAFSTSTGACMADHPSLGWCAVISALSPSECELRMSGPRHWLVHRLFGKLALQLQLRFQRGALRQKHARNRRHKNLRRAGLLQDARAFWNPCTRGEDLGPQQDLRAGDFVRVGYRERPGEVLLALRAPHPGL